MRATWLRHARYGTGRRPSVAVTLAGAVVAVHQSAGKDLKYRLGALAADGSIRWSGGETKYDTGQQPTIQATDPYVVSERHQGESNAQNRWTWTGTVDVDATKLTWSGKRRTNDPLYPRAHAKNLREDVVFVESGPFGDFGGDVVQYQTARIPARIVYPQLAATDFLYADLKSPSRIRNDLAYDTVFHGVRWYRNYLTVHGAVR